MLRYIFLFILLIPITTASAPKSPIDLDLSFSETPKPGNNITLEGYAHSYKPEWNWPRSPLLANVSIVLSDCYQSQSSLSWIALYNKSYQFSVPIKVISAQNCLVEATIRMPHNTSTYFGAREFIYVDTKYMFWIKQSNNPIKPTLYKKIIACNSEMDFQSHNCGLLMPTNSLIFLIQLIFYLSLIALLLLTIAFFKNKL